MPYDRFLIAPMKTGLETSLKPWQIPDDAFASLINAYVFRGRVRKRFGSQLTGVGSDSALTAPLFSRLSIPLSGGAAVGITDAGGNATGTIPGPVSGTLGQLFSIGDEIFTVYQLGTPGDMLDTGAATTANFNTTSGVYNFVGATPLTQIYYYPGNPVMGICSYEIGSVNQWPTYVFDTQFAYTYTNGFWQLSPTSPLWEGSDSDFFWTCNWRSIDTNQNTVILFVTNFNVTTSGAPALTDDPMYFYNGATWSSFSVYTIFRYDPTGDAFTYIVSSARIILPFKDRLILLNTVEAQYNNTTMATVNTWNPQRCRFSHNGSPFAANAWLEPNQTNGAAIADGAGFVDAPTEEQIVSAEFIKDRLIVYFEQSTWELVYTQSQVLPFVWQKINTELGSEATFSTVPFDKVVMTMGTTGVHACSGANVERIDNKIPDEVFQIQNQQEGVFRVYGIRDYFTEMVYWTFPGTNEFTSEAYTAKFPNQVLVYNYKNDSWAINEDCITAFGYFDVQPTKTWATAPETWEEALYTWNSGEIIQNFRQVIAGNQQGFVFIVSPDISSNANVMQITNMVNGANLVTLTIQNHTLVAGFDGDGDYIQITNAQGITGLNGNIYNVYNVVDANNIQISPAQFTGVYTGGGTVARVSNIKITSKQWNPYVDKGRNVYVAKIDFCVTRTEVGQITVDYTASSASDLYLVSEGQATGMILGNNILETSPYDPALYPLETYQERLWHPIYFQSDGEFIQLYISMSQSQLTDPAIAFSDFEIEGMTLYTQPTRARLE